MAVWSCSTKKVTHWPQRKCDFWTNESCSLLKTPMGTLNTPKQSFFLKISKPVKSFSYRFVMGFVFLIETTEHGEWRKGCMTSQWEPNNSLSIGRHLPQLLWSKFHGANMGPIWGLQDPGRPHVGPMNFAIWDGKWMTNLDRRNYYLGTLLLKWINLNPHMDK